MRKPRFVLVVTVALAIAAVVRPVQADCDNRSAASLNKLKINWRVLTIFTPENTASADTGAVTIKRSDWADQPMIVYIPTDDPKDSITRKLENVVFVNEKLAIAAKFFDTIRVSRRDALEDPILSDHAFVTPRVLLLRRDYSIHASLRGKQITASKLLKAMKSLVRTEYVNDFDKMLRGFAKVLDELDLLAIKKAVLDKKRQRLEKKPNAAKEKTLDRDEEAYDEAMEKLMEREDKLLELRRKDAA